MHVPQAPHTRLALNTILTDLGKEALFNGFDELRNQKAACFVSLHMDLDDGERLRGCIGTLEPARDSLYDEIVSNAKSAAFHDPRFPPVSRDDLADLTISVDVLDTPEFITSQELLDPKIYGVIVETDFRRGVLLPNLDGVETVERQLEIAYMKAGIRLSEEVKLHRFKVTRYH